MQSDLPQGDPQLQRTKPGPKVATGFVDPCIIYLEDTLPGEIPLLAAILAFSSKEMRAVDGRIHLALEEILALIWIPVEGIWRYSLNAGAQCLSVTDAKFLTKQDYATKDSALLCRTRARFTGEIKKLSATQLKSLTLPFTGPHDSLNKTIFAKKILEHSRLDWPSIAEALTLMGPTEKSKYSTA
jgi:hypothetical protein